jgi:hypothetical protein
MVARDLASAKRRLERWRRSRQGCGRIPNELWRMAAEVAAEHGPEATARSLQLDAKRLRQWMGTIGREASPSAPFVELPPIPLGSAAECTFDVEDPSGRKLRICLKGEATSQALSLGQILWRGES